MIAFVLICGYLLLLLTIAMIGKIGFIKNSAADYFLASRTCGSFLLVMTIFGTTMSSFALVGSTNEAFRRGIGVYGLMASWSGLIHSACFFIIGTKLWYHGKRFGYSTQIQFFRDRFQSPALGYILFPILVSWVIPYVMLNILGSGGAIQTVTAKAFPSVFTATHGGIPAWLGSGVVCIVVLVYVFSGGMRSLSFANGIHATVLVLLGGIILALVVGKLGGPVAASEAVLAQHPEKLTRGPIAEGKPDLISQTEFLTYLFVPLSVGMFPHLFQHWMTAKDAKTFRPVVILHPFFIMLVWAPCILLGVWATSAMFPDGHLLITRSQNGPEFKVVLAVDGQEAYEPVHCRFSRRRHSLGHDVARFAVSCPFEHVHARHYRQGLGRTAFQRSPAHHGRPVDGRGHRGHSLLPFAQSAADHLRAGRLVFFRFLGPLSADFHRFVLAARHHGRRDRLDHR